MRSPGPIGSRARGPRGSWLVLAALLATGCVRAVGSRADHWWSIRTAHVHVETDAGRERGVAEAERLEDLHRALVASFYDCTEHDADVAEVTILANEEEHRRLFSDTPGVSLSPSDGILALPRRIVTNTAELGDLGGRQLVAHELAHGFVETCFPSAPPWLHEGLASVFETVAVPAPDRAVIGYPSTRVSGMPFFDTSYEREGMVVGVVPEVALPPARALAHMTAQEFYHPAIAGTVDTTSQARAASYAAATQLAYMLSLGPWEPLRARFVTYLRALRVGRDQDVAFEMAFAGVDLDGALAVFLARPSYHVHERALPPAELVPTIATPMARAEVHLRLAEVEYQARGGASGDVQAHLARADLDASMRAQVLLLRATMEPWWRRSLVAEAVEIAPDDLDVLRARGLLALRDRDRAAIDEVAQRMEARIDLRASDAVVLADLERTLGRLDEAQQRLETLLARDRSVLAGWVMLGRIALERGDRDTATGIASAMRTVVHHRSSDEVRAALSRLDADLNDAP